MSLLDQGRSEDPNALPQRALTVLVLAGLLKPGKQYESNDVREHRLVRFDEFDNLVDPYFMYRAMCDYDDDDLGSLLWIALMGAGLIFFLAIIACLMA